VIDVTDGSNITVTGNIFSRCKYQSQIAVFLNSPQTGNDYIISNNTIEGVEATSASALIVLRTYGNRVVVQNNTILCPAHPTQAIEVFNTATVFICGNTIDTDNDTWYDFTNSTNVQIANNTGATSINYQQYFDLTNNEFVFDATAGRAVTLYQRDATLSDGEIIAELKCRQNDTSFPDTVMASVGFVAEGSTGSTAVAIYTGSGASPKQERVRVTSAGALRPTTDNSSALTLGTAAFRWSYVHAFVVRTHGLTVATLPTAATAGAGARAFVTDANATTFASVVAGGGANGVPVYSDGTNWRIG
jgi:hypothetical protein